MPPSPRTLDQILSELGSVYDPQINSIRQRQSMIPGQIAEEEKGLGAKQEQAFGDILTGARGRGLGFSGIPLGEQARYTSTEYLPALARLRQSGREQAMSLEDAILGIQERRQGAAMDQQRYEQSRYDTWRAQQEQLAEQRRQAAAASAFRPTMQPSSTPTDKGTSAEKQRATEAVYSLLNTRNAGLIQKTYEAIRKSAEYGNPYDRMKLQLLQALHPAVNNYGKPVTLSGNLGGSPARLQG